MLKIPNSNKIRNAWSTAKNMLQGRNVDTAEDAKKIAKALGVPEKIIDIGLSFAPVAKTPVGKSILKKIARETGLKELETMNIDDIANKAKEIKRGYNDSSRKSSQNNRYENRSKNLPD